MQDYPLLIPYQIDFHSPRKGKKHHDMRWRFGFVNLRSLISGKTGASCRGLELDIHLVWSSVSGKYFVYLNDVPFYQGDVPSRIMNDFTISFSLPDYAFPGNHQIDLTIVEMPPNELQFGMQFDGQHYSSFCRIFEIGDARMLDYYRATLDDMIDKGILSADPYPGRGGRGERTNDNRHRANQNAPAHYNCSTRFEHSNNSPNQYATSQPQHTMQNNRQSTYKSERKISPKTIAPVTQENDKDLMNFADEESIISDLTLESDETDVTVSRYLDSRLQNHPAYQPQVVI